MKFFNWIKWLLLVTIYALFQSRLNAQPGQCLNQGPCTFNSTSLWPTSPVNITSSSFTVVSNALWPGDYSIYNVVQGTTYEWSLCTADGANVGYDAQLSLFNANGTQLLCYSDDVCGNAPKIRWTATYSGQVRLQLNEFSCQGGAQLNTTLVARVVPAASVFDAEITAIYTLGTTSIPAGNPQLIRAVMLNAGNVTLNNVPVTLNITGANPYNQTITIMSLPPGSTTEIIFNFIDFTNTGSNTITVSANVPNDATPANNTKTMTQSVTNNAMHYAYGNVPDDGLGISQNGTGEIAAKFNVSGTVTISQINLHFFEPGAQYVARIYGVTGSNQIPGAVLYTSATQVASTGVNTLSVPNIQVTGPFYVGIVQTTGTFLSLGVQDELPIRRNTFYTRVPATSNTWLDFDANELDMRPMVGVSFGCPTPPAPGPIQGNATVCAGTQQTYSVAAVPGATAYIWTLPPGWTGSSTTNAITATVGTQAGNISVVAVNSCGNSAASNMSVAVNQPGNAAFSYPFNTYCFGGPNPVPSVASAGIFTASPAGVVFVSQATGEINLAASQPGTYTITFTVSGPCPASSSTTLQILSAPSATFSYPQNVYCKGGANNPVPILAPGATAGNFSATPAGLAISSNGVISLANSQPGTYTVVNSIPASGTCAAASASTTVVILPQPTANISGGGNVCAPNVATVNINLTGTAPFSFTYFTNGVPTNIVGYTSNVFVINAVESATYTLGNVSDATNCSNTGSGTVTVTVNQPPQVTYNPVPNQLCNNAQPITLSGGLPPGGSYTGPGVNNGVFNPTGLLGPIQINYSYTSPQTGCSGSATSTITIFPVPEVTLAPFTTPICIENGPIVLTGGLPVGGSYIGPGVSNNIFDPIVAGIGTHNITYVYVAGICANSAAQPLTVTVCTELPPSVVERKFTLWPNPASDILHIIGPEDWLLDADVCIVSANGSTIRPSVNHSLDTTSITLSVKSLPPGIYRLILTHEGKRWQHNIIIR